jgi:cAMP-dependent protein kinase regulator
MGDVQDRLLQQREKAGLLAARDRLEVALAEFRTLEQQGRGEEAAAGYEGLARAWAQGSRPLRAMVACKTLLRLEPGHTTMPALIADFYTRRFVPPPRREEGSGESAEFELLPDGEGPAPMPLFSKLDRDTFLAVLEALEVRTFAPGEYVARAGEPGTSMFFMVEGEADVVSKPRGEVPPEVLSLVEGGVFGEAALITAGPRGASVRVTAPSTLLELTRARMVELSRRHPLVELAVQSFYRERAVDTLLRTHPMFSLLSYPQKTALAREFQLQRVEAGQLLLTAGQRGDAMYLLLRGRCLPYHAHPDGHETHYPVLSEGDLFGEISVLLDEPVTAMVRAEVPSVLLRLDRAACERHILGQPGMRDALLRMSAERLRRTARVLAERSLHDDEDEEPRA